MGVVASGLGLFRRRLSLLIGGAISLLPASLYLTATPQAWYVGFVPVAWLLLGTSAVQRNTKWLAGRLIAGGVVLWSMVAEMLY